MARSRSSTTRARAADWLYRAEVEASRASSRALRVHYVATREGGPKLNTATLRYWLGARFAHETDAAVCGPPALIDAVEEIWAAAPERVLRRDVHPAALIAVGDTAERDAALPRSELTAAIAGGTLLEQAEAAGPDPGLRLPHGHLPHLHLPQARRRGRATSSPARSPTEEDEDIQLCISVPAGDVALDI